MEKKYTERENEKIEKKSQKKKKKNINFFCLIERK